MLPGNRGVGHARHHVSITLSFLQPSPMMKSGSLYQGSRGFTRKLFHMTLVRMKGKCESFFLCVCMCECVCACVLVFRTEENMANWLQQKLHSGNLRLSLEPHTSREMRSRHLHSWAPHGMWPFSRPNWEPAHKTPVGLSFLTEDDWQAGWKCHRVWSCMIPNHFSLSICRNHHSFWPHISPSNRAPHGKTTTGRARTYWTRPCHTSSGAAGVRGQIIWGPFWPAGHHTTLVWFQGTNPPLKWLISFFPNLNSSPTKPEI